MAWLNKEAGLCLYGLTDDCLDEACIQGHCSCQVWAWSDDFKGHMQAQTAWLDRSYSIVPLVAQTMQLQIIEVSR